MESVRTLATDEILIVFAVPAVQNPKIVEAQQGVSTEAAVTNPKIGEPEIIRREVSAVVENVEILRVLAVSAATNPKHRECTKCLQYFLEHTPRFSPKYWEQP